MARASGEGGEDAARRFAESRGYRTLARNVETAYGEIDLVLEDPAGTLVFAEVKTRASLDFGGGAAAVTRDKRRRLRRAGEACARRLGRLDSAMRFDVFAIEMAPKQPPKIEHIEDAF